MCMRNAFSVKKKRDLKQNRQVDYFNTWRVVKVKEKEEIFNDTMKA